MSYRCAVCQDVVKAGAKRTTRRLKRRDVPVCRYCAELIDLGTPLSLSLRKARAYRSLVLASRLHPNELLPVPATEEPTAVTPPAPSRWNLFS